MTDFVIKITYFIVGHCLLGRVIKLQDHFALLKMLRGYFIVNVNNKMNRSQ